MKFTNFAQYEDKNMTIIVGIDPGLSTGMAFVENGKIMRLETFSFWEAIAEIQKFPFAVYVVELSTTSHVWHREAVNKSAIMKTGFNVGKCTREAELIIDYLNKYGYIVQSKNPQGKKTATQFKEITGWTGKSNPHTRDAAMLAFTHR